MKSLEIIFVFVAAILTIITSYKWSELNLLSKISFVVLILASIFVAFNSFNASKKDGLIEKINAKFGDIDTSGSTVSRFAVGHEGRAIMQVDGTFFHHQLSDKKNYSEPILKATLENNRILLNVIIRDVEGEVIAVIDDSTWTIFDNNYEYNDDDHSFEMVTKGERDVYFQAYYKNGIIYLSGYFLSSEGTGLAMSAENGKSFMSLGFVKDIKLPRPSELKIPRIFKYPREKHYGEKL